MSNQVPDQDSPSVSDVKRKKKREEPPSSIRDLFKKKKKERKPREQYSTFSLRPDKDGHIPKTSQTRKKQAQHREHSRQPPSTSAMTTTSGGDFIGDNVLQHDELQDAKASLDTLMDGLKNKGYQPTEWGKRQQGIESDWKHYRPYITNMMLDKEGMGLYGMPQCYQTNCERQASIKCEDCSGYFFCTECDNVVHSSNPLHDRMSCKDGIFTFVPQEYTFPVNNVNDFKCSCGGTSSISCPNGSYIIITTKGRYDITKLSRKCVCCAHFEDPLYELENVIHRGFWPANPKMDKSCYLFDTKVLQMWQCTYRHLPQSSMSGFIAALNQISDKYDRKATINQMVFSRAVAEFTYLTSEMDLLMKQDPMQCPSCSISQLMSHVDGNHKLYRYNHVSSNEQQQMSYHGDRFVAKKEDVREHLQIVYGGDAIPKASLTDIFCGNSRWKAAREMKSRHSKMDKTGLVVAGCRHAIAQKAVNMYQGELYGYTHYLHVNFLLTNNVKYLFHDVVCKYWPWACKIAGRVSGITATVWGDSVAKIIPALSVLHAKAHSWHCQVCWGGRYVKGVGSGSGEDMEQTFSHLSRIGSTTKYMTSSGREDTITDHVLFWNCRKIQTLPELLCKRFKRVKDSLCSTQEKLNMICSSAGVNEQTIQKWTKEVEKAAKDAHTSRGKSADMGQLQEYFVLQQQVRAGESLTSFVQSSSEGMSAVLGQNDLFEAARSQVNDMEDMKTKLEDIKANLNGDEQLLMAQGKKEAVERVCQRLHADIELTANVITQRKTAFSDAYSTKQKTRYKVKNEADRKRIKLALEKLHQVEKLVNLNSPKIDISKSLDEIEKGQFPWSRTAEVGWNVKKSASDLNKFKERLLEEEWHLLQEMENFLRFFIRIQISLEKEIAELKLELNSKVSDNDSIEERVMPATIIKNVEETHVSGSKSVETGVQIDDQAQEEEEQDRYHVLLKNKTVTTIAGLIAIKDKGLKRTKTQICKGIAYFGRTTKRNGWRQIIFDHEDDSDNEDDEDERSPEENILDLVQL